MYPYSNPSMIAKGIELIKNIKWGSLLEGTSKTLNVINQAIPIVYQVKPLMGNVKTILNIANGLKEPSTKEEIKKNKTSKEPTDNKPIFYIE